MAGQLAVVVLNIGDNDVDYALKVRNYTKIRVGLMRLLVVCQVEGGASRNLHIPGHAIQTVLMSVGK